MSDVTYKIRVNRPCRLFIDDEEVMILEESKLAKINLPEGEYLRKVVAIDNSAIFDEAVIVLSRASKLEIINLDITGLDHAKEEAFSTLLEIQTGDFRFQKIKNVLGLSVVKCINKDRSEITIPTQITHANYLYDVISIGKSAFYGCSSLTSVTIPNSVTSIGDSAFSNCSSLASVIIPDSVTSIGRDSFSGCSALTSITIPNSVTSIGDGAFLCTGVFDNYFKKNSSGALYIDDCLIQVYGELVGDYAILPGTRLIAAGAFDEIYGSLLTSVIIPNSVTSIGDWAFINCKSLKSITIPNSVTSIGAGAFKGCTLLKSITIPNSVTSIGDRAFCECTFLTSITIPNSVTSIGDRAFSECKFLESITIPNSVTRISDGVFDGCTSLKSITIPNSVTSIGDWAFRECMKLESITIPNSVTSIGKGAFNGCTLLKSITIPDSVTSISIAFWNSYKLTTIYYTGTKAQWERIEKDDLWNNDSNIQIIRCTDGEIKI